MRFSDAADLIKLLSESTKRPEVTDFIDLDGAQAYVYEKQSVFGGKILYIEGTNEISDWFDYNLDVFDLFGREHHGFDVVAGDSNARWHAGFLEHAQYVYAFAKPHKPDLIIGHSLGGASGQIVGWSLNVPTITFGAPRPHRGRSPLKSESKIINLCRSDDTVCHVPPRFIGFRHVGETVWMSPADINFLEDHGIDNYIEILREDRIAKKIVAFQEKWGHASGLA